jgi:hypothetical protein
MRDNTTACQKEGFSRDLAPKSISALPLVVAASEVGSQLGMATRKSPSGIALPSPSPQGEKFSVPDVFSHPRPRSGINPRGDPCSLPHSSIQLTSIQLRLLSSFSTAFSSGVGFKQELLHFINKNKIAMHHGDTKQRKK